MIREIENLINGSIDTYAHVKIFPRGLPRYIDTSLRGTVRFGKRTGNSIAVLNPDNTFNFAEPPVAQSSTIVLRNPTNWISIGSLLSLGPGQEIVEVRDISDTTIILASKLRYSYSELDRVQLKAFPMKVFSQIKTGNTSILVKSHHPLANGDVVGYLQTSGLLDSFSEVVIKQAINTGITGEPFYAYLYHLILNSPISTNLDADNTVYLRAYPAYFSSVIPVPNSLNSSEPIGPFVLDLLGGRIVEGQSPDEVFSLRTTTRSGGYILGSSFAYETVEKNYTVGDRPLHAHTPMFWELSEGTMRITPSRVVFRVNEKHRFNVGTRCVPPFPGGKTWQLGILSNVNCTIRFVFQDYAPQEFALIANITRTVKISIPPGPAITRISINILSDTKNCEVSLSDWTPNFTANYLQYCLVARIAGQFNYQSTGLILKPYYLSSADLLGTSYDSGSNNDGGSIYL